jgi:hypothetical protein
MKTLLILLLITSCATYRKDSNDPVVRRQLIESVKIGVKCPNGYYYSFKADMCYSQTVVGVSRDIKPTTGRDIAAKPLKRKKTTIPKASIDCQEVFRRTNQCMGGKQ